MGCALETIEGSLATEEVSFTFSGVTEIERMLHGVALDVALKITPENPQYVIKRLLPDNCYKIVSGMPPHSERHGIGEVGHLLKPFPKRALLRAIDSNEIVVINDAPKEDEVMCYMAGHIEEKKISSIAIIPICRAEVRWLIIIDRLQSVSGGFSQESIELLEACKYTTDRALTNLSEEIVEDSSRTLRMAMCEYAHLLRNPLVVIGGFADRLKKTEDRTAIYRYADIISSHARRMEEEFSSFVSLVTFLFPNGHHAVREHVATLLTPFLSDDQYEVNLEQTILREEVEVVPEIMKAFCLELKKFIARSGRAGDRATVEAVRENSHLTLLFHSSAFQDFKEDADVRLPIFRQVAYKMNGHFWLGKNLCKVTLPAASSAT
jgi:hypothetical protein